jgi:dTDP-glucose 4,6-dehydratase
MTKTYLITGGAGFIGATFILHLLENTTTDIKIINLDALTYAANLENLRSVANDPRYTFIKGNITDKALVSDIFSTHKPDAVVHFAAESHVDNSIKNPNIFVETNVVGTQILLEAARIAWLHNPVTMQNRFHHISTDEVYGSLGETGYFNEDTAYAPNSPYSASKAASDMLVRAYFHTFGLNAVITNCSNNYGARQHGEKLIPTLIRNALAGKPLPIYGDGKNIRDWLHVTDHCTAINCVLEHGKAGETYVIGSNNEQDNLTIARYVCGILDGLKPRADGLSYTTQISFVEDRRGHDRRYAIDATKIREHLGWQASYSFEQGLAETVAWYALQQELSSAKPAA